MTSTTDRKAQLLRRRTELVDRIDEVEDELESHETKDWDDLAARGRRVGWAMVVDRCSLAVLRCPTVMGWSG